MIEPPYCTYIVEVCFKRAEWFEIWSGVGIALVAFGMGAGYDKYRRWSHAKAQMGLLRTKLERAVEAFDATIDFKKNGAPRAHATTNKPLPIDVVSYWRTVLEARSTLTWVIRGNTLSDEKLVPQIILLDEIFDLYEENFDKGGRGNANEFTRFQHLCHIAMFSSDQVRRVLALL